MKSIFLIILIVLSVEILEAQNTPANSKIDIMLLQGNYEKVIDTCKQIMTYDSLNPAIYYKIGIAYQNLLEDELSLSSFYKAAALDPASKVYNLMLAKGLYNKEKFKLAEPLFSKLCSSDSTKWVYAYYLTSIYMRDGRFDESINIYKRFLNRDPANCVYIDKMGFAYLRKKDFENAIDLYNKSLSINPRNLDAIKNLSYLYASTLRSDTAIQLLTRGMEIDSSDMDLYLRRATLYYSRNYTKRALDDYLKILSSGDTLVLYLKRIGIGYCKNLQPKESINYLLEAYIRDPSDYETCNYLGQSYFKLNDMKNSIYYYDRGISILTPFSIQLRLNYNLLAESQKNGGLYHEAIASYLKAQTFAPDPLRDMTIANLYDDKLKDKEKAIFYYEKFLDNLKNNKMRFTQGYKESIEKRVEYLKRDDIP